VRFGQQFVDPPRDARRHQQQQRRLAGRQRLGEQLEGVVEPLGERRAQPCQLAALVRRSTTW
jgi:hypothetical protein